jgi:hypothetical protein
VLLAPLLDVTVAPDWTSRDAAQRFREIWTLHVPGSGTPCYSEELGDLRGADEILGHHHDRRAYPLAQMLLDAALSLDSAGFGISCHRLCLVMLVVGGSKASTASIVHVERDRHAHPSRLC